MEKENGQPYNPPINPFVCTRCGDRFPSYRPLIEHAKAHQLQEDEEARNLINSLLSTSHTSPVKHAVLNQVAVKEEKNSFVCIECDALFSSYKLLMDHKKSHQYINEETPVLVEKKGKVSKTKKVVSSMRANRYKRDCKSSRKNQNSDLRCDDCNLSFEGSSQYSSHMKSHMCEEGKYKCEYCGEVLISRSSLKKHHLRFHTKAGAYRCENCNSSFTRGYHLSRHLRNQVCSKAGMKRTQVYSKAISDISGHKKKGKKSETVAVLGKTITIKKVDILIGNPIVLISLSDQVSVTKPFIDELKKGSNKVCEKCGQHFTTGYGLRRHMREVHSDSRDFGCERCGLHFKRMEDLKRHLAKKSCAKSRKSHLKGNQQKEAGPPLLPANLPKQETDPIGEIKMEHDSRKEVYFDAGVGGRRSSMRIALKQSLEDQESVDEDTLIKSEGGAVKEEEDKPDGVLTNIKHVSKKFICPKQSSTRNKALRTRHIRKPVVHGKTSHWSLRVKSNNKSYKKSDSESSRYKCKVCSLVCRSAGKLERHSAAHSSARRFKCHMCRKTYKYKDDLTRHLVEFHSDQQPRRTSRTSKEIKKVQASAKRRPSPKVLIQKKGDAVFCGICEEEFPSQRDLYAHLRKEHPAYLFRCKICSWGFCIPGQLKRHMGVHSDKRPFECDTCTNRYKYKCDLIEHVRRLRHSAK